MAVVVIQEFEATPEEYDQVNEKLGVGTPEGAILHAACDLGGGRMKSIDVWESPETFEAFAESRLGPGIGETLGDDAPAPPEPKFTELHNAYSI